jgi:hypothetical protein
LKKFFKIFPMPKAALLDKRFEVLFFSGGMEKQADSLDSVEEECTLPYDSVPIRYDPSGTQGSHATASPNLPYKEA